MFSTFCCLVGMLFLGCSHVAEDAGEAGAAGPKQVTVRVGEEVKLRGTNVRIKFLSVDDDSRCPQGVNCVWAGNVGVSLLLSAPGTEAARLKLNTAVEPQTVSFKGRTFKLQSVRPPRIEGQKINPKDYVITLVSGAGEAGGAPRS